MNPKVIASVEDPNFAFWHSATISQDGKKVLFTDELGGGGAADVQPDDRPEARRRRDLRHHAIPRTRSS